MDSCLDRWICWDMSSVAYQQMAFSGSTPSVPQDTASQFRRTLSRGSFHHGGKRRCAFEVSEWFIPFLGIRVGSTPSVPQDTESQFRRTFSRGSLHHGGKRRCAFEVSEWFIPFLGILCRLDRLYGNSGYAPGYRLTGEGCSSTGQVMAVP
jgi:hypothetical protein